MLIPLAISLHGAPLHSLLANSFKVSFQHLLHSYKGTAYFQTFQAGILCLLVAFFSLDFMCMVLLSDCLHSSG